jgi:hypothetical protein
VYECPRTDICHKVPINCMAGNFSRVLIFMVVVAITKIISNSAKINISTVILCTSAQGSY